MWDDPRGARLSASGRIFYCVVLHNTGRSRTKRVGAVQKETAAELQKRRTLINVQGLLSKVTMSSERQRDRWYTNIRAH